MDGGRRVLQPLKEALAPSASARPAYAGAGWSTAAPAFQPRIEQTFDDDGFANRPTRPMMRRMSRRRRRAGFLLSLVSRRGAGLFMASTLLLGTILFGAIRGGEYDTFVAQYGSPPDLLARAVGLRLNAITISGQRELSAAEILEAANISDRNSLLFLDAHAVRDRLKAVALVKDVDVRKLYPDRLMIDVTEREPYALWQKDGQVDIISADGTAIDVMRDQRFADLPFVVGNGADARVGEFLKILDAAGDLRSRIKAGVLVSERRWNLKMASGIDVKLPEIDPIPAAATLARLQREGRILEKDILSIDMRVPGRVVARLSEDAGAARAETLSRKSRGKGGTT